MTNLSHSCIKEVDVPVGMYSPAVRCEMKSDTQTWVVRVLLLAVVLVAMGNPLDLQGQSVSTPDTEGYQAGTVVGENKSVVKAHALGGTTSLMLPGSGLIWLLFLKSGDVQPNFVEQASLEGRSPTYVQSWAQGYDQAMTKREKKAILISTAVGSVISYFLIYRPLATAGY